MDKGVRDELRAEAIKGIALLDQADQVEKLEAKLAAVLKRCQLTLGTFRRSRILGVPTEGASQEAEIILGIINKEEQ